MKKKGVLAIVLAVALVFQISAFSATGVFAGELSGEESIPAASPSIAMPAEEQEAATPTEETAPAQQETEPAAPIEKAEPAAPAEEPAAPEEAPAQTEKTPAPAEEQPSEAAQPVEDPAPAMQPEAAAPVAKTAPAAPAETMLAAPAEETMLATPAANETLTAKFHFYSWDESGAYTVVKDVTRTVKPGGRVILTLSSYITNKNVELDGKTYHAGSIWKYDDGSTVNSTLILTYDQVAAMIEDGTTVDINLHAQYRTDVNLTINFTDIRHANGTVTESTKSQTIGAFNGAGFSKKTLESATGLTTGQHFSYAGYEYTYTGEWTDQNDELFDATSTIWFYNKEGVSDSHNRYISEDTVLDLKPVWQEKMVQGLDYHYIDNISTGSGSWSNADAFAYRSQFGSLTHTFKNPEEASPTLTPHYRFQYWQTDEYVQGGTRIPKEEGKQYKAGDSFTYTVDSGLPEGTVTDISIYAYWQPSVTVNWHTQDGGLDQNAPNSGSIESFDPTTAIEAYSYTPANIQHEVTDEEGNVQTVTFTFDGWYDKDGNKVEENAGYTAPGITKEKVERSLVDLYPHYTRSIAVTKAWDDADNQDGLRTESVSVDLLAGEEVVSSEVLSEDNAWTCTFDNLAAFDEDGKVIEYTAAESQIPEAYTASVSSAVADGVQTLTVTNSHTPEVRDITISKVWNDNNDQYRQRPASVTIELLANGNTVERMQLTSDNGWSWVFRGLDKYSDGEEIVYTVREMAIPNYSGAVTGNAEDGFTVTNTSTYVPPVDPDDTPDTPNPPVVPGTTTPDDPAGPGTTNPPAGPATTGTTTTAAPAAPAAPASTINSDPAPRTNPDPVTITDPAPPQTPGTAYWALINLICAILTVLISLVLLVLYFTRRKNDSEENEYQDAQIGMQMSEEDKTERKKKGIFRLLSILPAIAGVVLFLLTENMHNPMRFIDEWTIWMAVILLANVILAILSKKRKDEEESEQQTAGQTA